MSELLLINPSRRKKRRKMSALQRKYFGKRRSKRKVTARRRRNPVASAPRRHKRRAVGYTVGRAPIRRRKMNPRRHTRAHSHRRYRRHARNPRFVPSLGGLKKALLPAAIGAGGAIALDIGLSYVPLPAFLQSQWAKVGVQIAGSIALGMIAGKLLGAEKGKIAAGGALTVVAYNVIRGLVKQFAPSLPGLSGDYADMSVGAYMPGLSGGISPAPMLQGMGAYMDPLASLQQAQMGCIASDGM